LEQEVAELKKEVAKLTKRLDEHLNRKLDFDKFRETLKKFEEKVNKL
jgi:chemotaxis regulatin CheY-phosphate phosphatase CheZ